MDTVLTVALTVFLAVLLLVLVPLLIDLRKTLISLRKTSEEKLNPALDELSASLKRVTSITESADAIVSDIRFASHAVHDLGEKVVSVGRSIDEVSSTLTGTAKGLRAGILAGAAYFITHALKKGD